MNSTPENLPQIYDPPLDLPSFGAGFLVHSYGERSQQAEPDLEDAYYVMWRFVHGGFSVKRSHGKGAPEYRMTVFDVEADDMRPLDTHADEPPLPDKYKIIPGRYLGVNTIVEIQAFAKGEPLNDPQYRYFEVKGRPDLTDKILQPDVLAKELPRYTADSIAIVSEQLAKDFGISPKVV